MSHLFIERLTGSIRQELLDQTFFWTATDLEDKLREYQCYYNEASNSLEMAAHASNCSLAPSLS